MKNRYAGTCACGAWVDAEEGVAFKSGAKWVVRCDYCERNATAPAREMVGAVYWPNGEGFTECSAEYEEAVNAAQDARDALEEVGGYGASFERGEDPDPRYHERYEAYCRADAKVQNLLGEGGHLGERIRFETPDPVCALLGGGKMTVAPGGQIGIAD